MDTAAFLKQIDKLPGYQGQVVHYLSRSRLSQTARHYRCPQAWPAARPPAPGEILTTELDIQLSDLNAPIVVEAPTPLAIAHVMSAMMRIAYTPGRQGLP
jgi:hypothetical protein